MELYFYPRLREEGDLTAAANDQRPDGFLSTLREEGDGCTGIVKPMLSISIHASARRATTAISACPNR